MGSREPKDEQVFVFLDDFIDAVLEYPLTLALLIGCTFLVLALRRGDTWKHSLGFAALAACIIPTKLKIIPVLLKIGIGLLFVAATVASIHLLYEFGQAYAQHIDPDELNPSGRMELWILGVAAGVAIAIWIISRSRSIKRIHD